MNPLANRIIDRALLQPAFEFKQRQGKRFRYSMVQLSFQMAGGRGTVPSLIADAIECLHAGSLVIDDVQDESMLRRGEPTLHRVIGVPLAINVGNWMYFRAIEQLVTASLPGDQSSRLVQAMVTAGRRCHEGQAIDLYARVDQIPAAQWKEVVDSISLLKTGILVELAVAMGGIAANASDASLGRMMSFGRQIGVALQMRNDLDELNKIAAESASTGEVRDDDLRNARMTWPWVWAFELAGESRCHSLVQTLGGSHEANRWVAAELVSIVQTHADQVIFDLIANQIRLLSEHVVQPDLLVELRDCLQVIQQPQSLSWARQSSESLSLLGMSSGVAQ
jgi:geranylgeranyl pyrophosphate synthase